MTREEFEKLVEEEFPRAVPEKFHHLLHNVDFLVEDEPDARTRAEHGLKDDETLLGLYRGVPHTARGDMYGVGATLPDSITLYQKPIEDEAAHAGDVRMVIRETIWHEVAHHFGFDEDQVEDRERRGI
ncbi:MAG: metallopeptidase family protein [Patescibacteria group bacterium]|nr:metallopeptidase family protein [Patescibacteria group bacterium]